eukprot:Awhi_evm1s5374
MCKVVEGEENEHACGFQLSIQEFSKSSLKAANEINAHNNATFRIPFESFLSCLNHIENMESKRKTLQAELE